MAESGVSIEELVEALDQEFEKLRREAAERAEAAGRGAVLVGTAGAFGLVSAVALGSLPLLALRRVMPSWLIALVVAAGTAAAGAVFARMGLARLAAVAPQALERELEESAKEVAQSVG